MNIDYTVFLVSLCVGLLYVYFTMPKPQVIIKYPTPENAGNIIYRDKAGVCYKYRAREVPCTEEAQEIPIQT